MRRWPIGLDVFGPGSLWTWPSTNEPLALRGILDRTLSTARCVPLFVSDPTNVRNRFALGIVKRPVVALGSGHDGARLTAAHHHQDIRSRRHFVREHLRFNPRDVNTDLTHHFDDFRVNAGARLRSGGDGAGLRGVRSLLKSAAAICVRPARAPFFRRAEARCMLRA